MFWEKPKICTRFFSLFSLPKFNGTRSQLAESFKRMFCSFKGKLLYKISKKVNIWLQKMHPWICIYLRISCFSNKDFNSVVNWRHETISTRSPSFISWIRSPDHILKSFSFLCRLLPKILFFFHKSLRAVCELYWDENTYPIRNPTFVINCIFLNYH